MYNIYIYIYKLKIERGNRCEYANLRELTGKMITLEVEVKYTIEAVKDKMERASDIYINREILGGKQEKEGRRLGDYDIQECTLQLAMSLRGDMFSHPQLMATEGNSAEMDEGIEPNGEQIPGDEQS